MRKIENIIVRSFSGDITPEEKGLLSRWLSESTDNEIYFAQLKNIWQVSRSSFTPEEINVEKAERLVLRRIESEARTVASAGIPFLIWWQRIAAVVLLPLILTLAFVLYKKDIRGDRELVYQEVVSPPGTLSKIKLTDGTEVWLNSKSSLKYPVVFSKGKREVFLSGEAYFEVRSDARNPFVVKTGDVDIKATGTAFNVEAFDTERITAITLAEGKVGVKIGGKKNIDIRPEQRMIYDKQQNTYRIEAVNSYKWLAWKDGILMFRDDPLEYVFKRIGLAYNVLIEVEDKELGSHPYRATFEDESLNEILNLLELSAPIKYMYTKRGKTALGTFSKEKIKVYKK